MQTIHQRVCYAKSSWCQAVFFVILESWKMNCFRIRLCKAKRSKCGNCERVRTTLLHLVTNCIPLSSFFAGKFAHIEFAGLKIREHTTKTSLSKYQPLDFRSVGSGSADQSPYTLLHFVYNVETHDHGIDVYLVGLLHHRRKNYLYLYTMTNYHETSSNHIIECMHRLFSWEGGERPIPNCLLI